MLHLIVVPAELNSGPVPSLVDILVDVFDGFEGEDRLHIDVTLVLEQEIGRVRDHKSVVHLMMTAHPMESASVPASVAGIGVL